MIGAELAGGACQRCDADLGPESAPCGIRLAVRSRADEERPYIARDMIQRGESIEAILAFVSEPSGGAIVACRSCCAELLQVAALVLGEDSGIQIAPKRRKRST